MAKVILRQEAIDDLTDIWDYTLREWSEPQAENIMKPSNLLVKKLEKIRASERIKLKFANVQSMQTVRLGL